MPNWCVTHYTFYVTKYEHLEQLYAMHRRFREILGAEYPEDCDFPGWLGNYANALLPEYGAEKVDCRGSVCYIDEVTDVLRKDRPAGVYFSMQTETAWDAKVGMWWEIIKRHYPDVTLTYVSEEPGCGYFLKWDKSGRIYRDQYYVDGCLPAKGKDKYVYLSDLFDGYGWDTDINELQSEIDAVSTIRYKHADTYQEVYKNMQEALEAIGDKELFFDLEKYEEVAPWEFDFLLPEIK